MKRITLSLLLLLLATIASEVSAREKSVIMTDAISSADTTTPYIRRDTVYTDAIDLSGVTSMWFAHRVWNFAGKDSQFVNDYVVTAAMHSIDGNVWTIETIAADSIRLANALMDTTKVSAFKIKPDSVYTPQYLKFRYIYVDTLATGAGTVALFGNTYYRKFTTYYNGFGPAVK